MEMSVTYDESSVMKSFEKWLDMINKRNVIDFEIGPRLWIGRNVGIAAAGHHILTKEVLCTFTYQIPDDEYLLIKEDFKI